MVISLIVILVPPIQKLEGVDTLGFRISHSIGGGVVLGLGFVKACLYLRIASGLLVPEAKLFLHLEDLLYVDKAKPHDRRMMRDSPIVQTKFSETSRYTPCFGSETVLGRS